MHISSLSEKPDAIAPDGSEIRFMYRMQSESVSVVHCTLLPGEVSIPVYHPKIEETWYCIEGIGEFWRKGQEKELLRVYPGVAFPIPVGTHFQFRNTGESPLKFILNTIPAWPLDEEEANNAVVILDKGEWKPDLRKRDAKGNLIAP